MVKTTYYLTAFILAATSVDAGGLAPPIDTSTPVPPVAQNWSGAYVGLSYGQTTSTTTVTTTTQGEPIYQRQCSPTEGHTGKKCSFSGHEDSAEIAALDRLNSPWRVPGFKVGQNHDAVVYDDQQSIMWLSDPFTYTTAVAGDPVAIPGKNAENVLLDTIIPETSSISELTATEAGVGAFIGYRWDMGVVAGVEASSDGTMTTVEASAGMPMGDLLAYGFIGAGWYDGTQGNVYGAGADYRITDNWVGGVKTTIGEFDAMETETVAFRVAYKF